MASRFRDKLKKIRDASQARSEASHKARTQEDIDRTEKTVRAFEYREEIEAVIEELVRNFQAEAPDFVLTRGFFEGKYMLALRLDEQLLDANGRIDSYFSRLMLLLDPHTNENTFGVQCRKTIRNRDLETTVHADRMDEAAKEGFGRFIEEQFLTFAEGYFGDTTLTRPSKVPT
ncbi:MAG: hypothetical protein H6825_13310 [Planctomycetes bacterium]|nr:hypothetical protein [Planctomycetota bacterium]